MSERARILVIDDSPTILKVVAAILARHGLDPVTARDGASGLELIRTASPKIELVLLDFVMPRMNGYQFCRELRSGEHRTLPVVLMSAKGDKIRGQFVLQTGAVDAITKPFDARALVAVVEGALAKAAEGRARPVPVGAHMPDEDTLADSVRGAPSMRSIQQQQQRAGTHLAQQIAQVVVPAVLSLPRDKRDAESALMVAVAQAITPEVMQSLTSTLRDSETHSPDSKEVLSGEMGAIPLAEVLQVLQMQRQTGVIRITNGRATYVLYLRQGNLDFVHAVGSSSEFRLGRYFLERGLLRRDELESLLKQAPPGKLLGEVLLERNLITRDDLTDALAKQSSELVYDVLRWTYGHFSMTREPFRKEAELAKLGLGVGGLVLEGFRRVDEWRLMESTIQFDQVVVVDRVALEAVGEGQLTAAERRVLEACDGKRTVSEIVAETALGSFDAVKVIYQFLKSRVLRPKPTQPAGNPIP